MAVSKILHFFQQHPPVAVAAGIVTCLIVIMLKDAIKQLMWLVFLACVLLLLLRIFDEAGLF